MDALKGVATATFNNRRNSITIQKVRPSFKKSIHKFSSQEDEDEEAKEDSIDLSS